jgi:hypothetical protein
MIVIKSHQLDEGRDRVGGIVEHRVAAAIRSGLPRPCTLGATLLDRHVIVVAKRKRSGFGLKAHGGESGGVSLSGEQAISYL